MQVSGVLRALRLGVEGQEGLRLSYFVESGASERYLQSRNSLRCVEARIPQDVY